MTTFSTNPYFALSNVSSVILHSLSRNCFATKNQAFISISKSVVTFINVTATNISNNIIKQYYGVLNKKRFSRTNIFIYDRSITLNKQAFFDFKNIFMMSICQDVKLVKGWDTITI